VLTVGVVGRPVDVPVLYVTQLRGLVLPKELG